VQKSANTYIKLLLLSLSRVNKKIVPNERIRYPFKKKPTQIPTQQTRLTETNSKSDEISFHHRKKKIEKKYCEQFAAYTKTQFHNHLRQKLWNNYSNHGG